MTNDDRPVLFPRIQNTEQLIKDAYQRGYVAGFDKGRDEALEGKIPLPEPKPTLPAIRVEDATFRKDMQHYMRLATPEQRVYVILDDEVIIAMGGS